LSLKVSTNVGVIAFKPNLAATGISLSPISDFFFATENLAVYNLHYQNSWSLRLVSPAGSTSVCPGSNLSGTSSTSIFYVGTDWFISQFYNANPNTTNVWVANFIGGNAQVLDNTYIATSDVNNMYFFGKDLSIYQMSYVSNTWMNYNLCTSATSATSAIKSIAAAPSRLYYAGSDCYIHELYFSNNAWTQLSIQSSSGNATNVGLGPIICTYMDTIAFFSDLYADICTLVYGSTWKYTSLFSATNQLGYTISNIIYDTSSLPGYSTTLSDDNLLSLDQHTNVNYGSSPYTTTITINRMKSATFTNSYTDSNTSSIEITGTLSLGQLFSVSAKAALSNTYSFSSTDSTTIEDTTTESYTITVPSATKIDAIYKTYKTNYDIPYTATLTNNVGYAIEIEGAMNIEDRFSLSQFLCYQSAATSTTSTTSGT